MPTFEVTDDPEVARLVRFSTGKLNPESKDRLDFKCYSQKDAERPGKRKMVVTTELNDMKFSGQNFGKSNHFSTDLCDYYVAVHRKGADKVQIMPAAIVQLHPQFEETTVASEDQTDKTYMQKRANLVKQFGSGQLQRKVNKAEKMRLEEGMVSATTEMVANRYTRTLKENGGTSQTGEATTPTTNVVESSVVPPHNKQAERPEDVYLLETIIPQSAMEALVEQSQAFLTCTAADLKQWKESKEYPDVILSLLENQPSVKTERCLYCCCVMYLHCLIHTYRMAAHKFRVKTGKYPESWKGEVKKLLDEQFTTSSQDRTGKRVTTRPAAKKDLTLSHILVLYMRLSNFSMALKPLVTDLKLPMKRLSLHSQILGFRVKAVPGMGQMTATLTLPLQFPQPKLMEKKKR